MKKRFKKQTMGPKTSAIKPTRKTLATTERGYATHKRLSTKQVQLLREVLNEAKYKLYLIEAVIKGAR